MTEIQEIDNDRKKQRNKREVQKDSEIDKQKEEITFKRLTYFDLK